MIATHVEDRGGSLATLATLTQSPLADILALSLDAGGVPAPVPTVEIVVEDVVPASLPEQEVIIGAEEDDPFAPHPPPDARFWLCREDARECEPGDVVYMWTWSGGPKWYYAAQYPAHVPAWNGDC